MRAEDFSVWLSGVARLSATQRREALARLAKIFREDGVGSGERERASSPGSSQSEVSEPPPSPGRA